jgi:hypothetical protein
MPRILDVEDDAIKQLETDRLKDKAMRFCGAKTARLRLTCSI